MGLRRLLSPEWIPRVLVAGDGLIVAGSIGLAYWYYINLDIVRHASGPALPFRPYIPAIPVAVVICIVSLAINRQYSSWRGRPLMNILLGLYSGLGLAVVLVLAAISIGNLGVNYSRLTITYAVVIAVGLMTAERYVLRQYESALIRQGVGAQRVLLVGTGPGSEMLVRRIAMFPQYGYRVCGVLDDRHAKGSLFAGVPIVGGVDELPAKARELATEHVLIAMSDHDRSRVTDLLTLCEGLRLDVKIVPDLLDVTSARTVVDTIDGLPLIGIRSGQFSGLSWSLKRVVDVVVSAIALAVLFLPMVLIGAIVKATSSNGPVFFRQDRIGMNRRPFVVFKFRTMIPDAEAVSGPAIASRGDPRVTPFGRLLRKLSIDELPQLWNVLKGDMSLVGPRPQPKFFDDRYRIEVPRYGERQKVRPGLTGWAEANGLRGAAPILERTVYDIYYIENWSLIFDLNIMFLTAIRIFFQRHAY